MRDGVAQQPNDAPESYHHGLERGREAGRSSGRKGLPQCRKSAEEVRDWLQLENWFEKSSVELLDKNHKTFMVNMLGFKSVFDELEQDELDAALHTSECRWMFEAVKMSGRLRHLLGEQNVGEITFASPVFNQRTREELQCLCGSLMNVPDVPAHDLIKHPVLFCFPSGCTWNDASCETQLPVDKDGCLAYQRAGLRNDRHATRRRN